ncbi:MAG: hypothetical protein KKD01_15935 [Proteobacteria bacterium]|nr:hypothetical protein [Pseudomonadota bacterium]MBU1140285.1 hypothetical protein [Pseudomonadota bacterium]MBU1234075.1 hypothetical protein [Pseudomonadota bacterium]MBU1418193.1 hypothetical protein [Pseudomonadota bacterium]MBU1456215.1 hypothetical protein [Pseudomonadota bacterium]
MEKTSKPQAEPVEVCECNNEWRGVLGGNDWEECQCYVVEGKDEDEDKEAQNPKCH